MTLSRFQALIAAMATTRAARAGSLHQVAVGAFGLDAGCGSCHGIPVFSGFPDGRTGGQAASRPGKAWLTVGFSLLGPRYRQCPAGHCKPYRYIMLLTSQFVLPSASFMLKEAEDSEVGRCGAHAVPVVEPATIERTRHTDGIRGWMAVVTCT
jgi:hypothetical protein